MSSAQNWPETAISLWHRHFKGQYTQGDKLQPHVTATHHSNKSLCVYWCIFVKLFVTATEFCHCNRSLKFSLSWFFATCVATKRQRFSQKFSSSYEAICRCDMLLQLLANLYTRDDLSPLCVFDTCCLVSSYLMRRWLLNAGSVVLTYIHFI